MAERFDEVFDVRDSFGGLGMRRKESLDRVALTVAKRIELLEERHHPVGVVAGVDHVANPQTIRLALRVTPELHERSGGDHLGREAAEPTAGTVSEDRPEHAQPKVRVGGPLGLLRAVPRDDVPNLVTEDADELRLIICSVNQAAVDVDEATGQRERIDLGSVDHLELIRDPRTCRLLS